LLEPETAGQENLARNGRGYVCAAASQDVYRTPGGKSQKYGLRPDGIDAGPQERQGRGFHIICDPGRIAAGTVFQLSCVFRTWAGKSVISGCGWLDNRGFRLTL